MERLVTYLKRERQWSHTFSCRRMVEEVTTFTDSDCAGSKENRQSSSAGVILLGNHVLKAYTRKQHIIARSSAEAELYAAAVRASVSKAGVSMMSDLGYTMQLGQGICRKSILMRHTCGCKMKLDPKGCKCEGSRSRKTLQTC